MEDLISVIIPIHNVENYLEECLNSVKGQTYTNIEILLINDSSTDNSQKICEKYLKIDSRFKLYHIEEHSAGLSRNFGIRNANGKYCVFLDSDDYIDLNYIELLYFEMCNNNLDACFCGYSNFNDSKREIIFENGQDIIYDNDILKHNLVKNVIYVKDKKIELPLYAVWNGMYNISIIKKNNIYFLNENDCLSEDCIFNLDFVLKSKKVKLLSKIVYYHRTDNEASICNVYNKRYEKLQYWYEIIENKLKSSDCLNCYNEILLSERYVNFSILKLKQEILLNYTTRRNVINEIKNLLDDRILEKSIRKIDLKNRNKKNVLLIKLMQLKFRYIIYVLIKIVH